ncbi:helix-turn-helix domain-containing protein [Ralstonia syzygii]|uniref:Helix-turn-helix domain-containing protein n=1 Tax=Ralstonia syzygii TaxID=28097 RepID=A0ABX7ZIC9_9RALS|nr:AraC family transcriptional regulator [Ralstonia syzygii]QUP54738.1 helix-turn-helix domain-containing protein [Ralstonia syzygii]
MFGHSADKYVNSTMLQTSNALGWTGLLAERWTHATGELPNQAPKDTEVVIQLNGQSFVDRVGGGRRERTRGHRGTIWLCPAGVEEEYINIAESIDDCLHLFLPGQPFSDAVLQTFDIDPARAGVRYQAIDRDPLIEAVAMQILAELSDETGVGRLLVENLSAALSAHLVKHYSEQALPRSPVVQAPRPLDSRRLARVVDFITANLDQDFSVADLAAVAYMSVAHFTRCFRAATGQSPHAFVAEQRLSLARRRLLEDTCPIEEIAHAAGFSSQANFTKAFRKATGVTPGRYRSLTRQG